MIHPEVKLIEGVISLRSFLQKWNFILRNKISCKIYPKWNHMKGNICTCIKKIDWILLNRPFISDHPRNKIHFISPAIKNNVNRCCFMVGWNFVSCRFHFGSHVSKLLITELYTRALMIRFLNFLAALSSRNKQNLLFEHYN